MKLKVRYVANVSNSNFAKRLYLTKQNTVVQSPIGPYHILDSFPKKEFAATAVNRTRDLWIMSRERCHGAILT